MATSAPPASRRRARRGRGAHTREAILERATQIASTDGLEGLTIGRLAAEMRMSKSGLFGHFGSKQDLQIATVGAASQAFVHEVVRPAYEAEEGAARLRSLCAHYLDYLERRVFPGGCFFAAASTEFDGRPGPVRDAVRGAIGAWLRELERQARLAGAPAPAQLAFELHSLAQGANSAAQLFGERAAFARARAAMRVRLDELPGARAEPGAGVAGLGEEGTPAATNDR